MRTTELEAQIQDIEAKLAKLNGNHVGEVWVLTPISHQPPPPQALINQWVLTLGFNNVKAQAVPSRLRAVTAVVVTPNHGGAPQPHGWTHVALGSVTPDGRTDATTAWHHPTLAGLYREYLDSRDG